jgi:predicted enzyme related to lactoylglutathione lyase
MNRIVHFEVHAKDQDKLQKFYQDVFGWEFQDMGEQMGNYRLIITGKDEEGSQYKGINGGMNPREGELPVSGAPVNAFVCTISVENIDDILAKIETAGGTVATHKMDVPGVGWLAYRKDPEGNIFGVLQPAPRQN